jgi:predicted small lipoprotein YifL
LAIMRRHNVAAAMRCVRFLGKGPEKAAVERVLAGVRLVFQKAAFAAGLVGALGLAGCGRAGPLELPPGPAVTPAPSAQLTQPDGSPAPGSQQDTAVKTGFDARGNPVAATGPKRPFILDPLLQ